MNATPARGFSSESNMENRSWKYGLLAPIEGGERVGDQIWLAHLYQNKLVEIERARREESADVLRRHHPAIVVQETEEARLVAELLTTTAAIGKANADARSHIATEPMKLAVRNARAALMALRKSLSIDRKAAWANPAIAAELKTIDVAHALKQKAARAANRLYWGTYLIIEDACKDLRKGPPPKFKRWEHCGSIAVQVQGGMSVDELLAGTDTRVRLQREGRRAVLWVRIGSDGRQPIWARFPMLMHREFPEGAKIKWVRCVRERIATHDSWNVLFSIEAPTPSLAKPTAYAGRVGINFGWRVVRNGLRVAYWIGSDGAEGELILPHRDVARWTKCDDLQAIRDQNFNVARNDVAAWIKTVTLPEEFAAKLDCLHQWRSPARLTGAVLYWREHRMECDDAAHAGAEAWRKQDKHLYEWQANNLDKAMAWRKDLYRCFARDIALRYGESIIEATNRAKMQESPNIEDAKSADVAIVKYRRMAAVSIIGQCLTERMDTRKVDAKYITQTCAECGHRHPFDALRELVTACPKCEFVEDQDRRAARNLLASGDVVSTLPETVRSDEGDGSCAKKVRRNRKARKVEKQDHAQTGSEIVIDSGVAA